MKPKNKQNKIISAGEFKAKCLSLMDEVAEKSTNYVVTKRGKAVAKLVPVDNDTEKTELIGCLEGSLTTYGDIITPLDAEWEALK